MRSGSAAERFFEQLYLISICTAIKKAYSAMAFIKEGLIVEMSKQGNSEATTKQESRAMNRTQRFSMK